MYVATHECERCLDLMTLLYIQPQAFNITMARTYKWQTENAVDQSNFLIAIIRLFRQVTGGAAALQLVGLDDPDAAPGMLCSIHHLSAINLIYCSW